MKLLSTDNIIFYAKANTDTWTCIEEATAFTIYKDIDYYEFCENTTLATVEIDLPKLIEKLNLNAKKFADEMFKYDYDIMVAEPQYFLTKIAFANANRFNPNA